MNANIKRTRKAEGGSGMGYRRAFALALGFLVLAATADAGVTVQGLSAIPRVGNAVISASLGQEAVGTPRLYFRRKGYGDFYFVSMRPAGGGAFWGILPEPSLATDAIEYYVSVRDGKGAEIERSSVSSAPVRDARPQSLAPDQVAAAGSLTVGDSAFTQKGHGLAWFSAKGVTTRVDAGGNLSTGDAYDETDTLSNIIQIGDPGPAPAPKEVTLPRP